MVYTVDEYLDMMTAAGRTQGTIRSYMSIFKSFAQFLDVPVNEVHVNLSSQTLIKYVGSMKDCSGQTIKQRLAILRAYAVENGVVFKGMELKVLNARRYADPEDKPISLEHLQKMMDLTDERGKAFISVMVSTGMRCGECAQLKIKDWDGGDTITIPGAIAKNGRGGKVYLTDEAQEYLKIWVRNREAWLLRNSGHTADIFQVHVGKGDRLFASGYSGLNGMFRRLYEKIDGEWGTYRRKITPHSLRKYFRTQAAAGGLHIDIVEKLMRHSGYLSGSYVRLDDDEVRKQFHEKEAALFITRVDHRIQGSKLDALQQANKALQERLQQVEEVQDKTSMMEKITAMKKELMKEILEEMQKSKTQ